jgi:hypothetical protein
MFNKLVNIKKYSKEIISINDLVDIVKNNPQQDLISKIRSVEYKSKEYNNLKLKVNAITPHGIFSSLENKGLINLSGYLYYDIDGFDTEISLNDTKQKLIDTNIVSFLCKSVGGRGLSFLIKLNDTINISNDTFTDTYNYVRELLIEKGFNIDKSANGLVRKVIISSDSDVYFNNKVSLLIDKVSYKNYIKNLNRSNAVKEKRKRSIKSNDTFSYSLFTLIDKDKLDLIEETPYTNKKDYDIQEIDYYKIFIPKEIKDGDKHRLYVRIMNALYYLNKNITMNEVYSYLYYINLKAANKMNDLYLRKYVYNICSNIEKNGVRIKVRKKKIHIDDKYDKNQKRIMGAKINGKLRQNKSIKLIKDACIECAKQNIIPTQKRIAEMTGLGIATVKRNWNKEVNDINNIEVPLESKYEDIKEERDYKLKQLTEIDEDLFWDNWQPKKVSQDRDEIVDKDWGESDGIPGLIETI